MTARAPWSVKGIDPRARELAKDLARQSGVTLGEWLNRAILEDVPTEIEPDETGLGEAAPEDIFLEAAPEPILQAPQQVALQSAPPVSAAPLAAAEPTGPHATLGRVVEALDRLTERIEASESRTGEAVAGIERSVGMALVRIEAAERETVAVTARLDGLAQRVDPERLRQIGLRSTDALAAFYARSRNPPAPAEDVMARLSERIGQAEASLSDALAALDERLRSIEGGAPLVTRHMRAVEERSARAIERMGREVLTLAEALNKRLTAAEQQSAAAVEKVGGEIVRVGALVEGKLARAEQAQADALEMLGAEIGRVTERLSERVAQSEQRAAQAIDDVGEQVAKVTERLEHRHERLAGDLAERLRESEARAIDRLDEARGGLDASLTGARDRLADAAADGPPPVHLFAPELFVDPDEQPDAAVERTALTAEDFAPLAEEPERPPPAEARTFEREVEDEASRPLNTRELIELARMAARAEASEVRGKVAGERRASARPVARRVGGFGFRTSARPPSSWQTALMLAGGAAFLSVGAAGVVLMEGQGRASRQVQVAATAPPAAPTARAALALAPEPIGPAAPVAGGPVEPAAAAGQDQAALDYAATVRDLETGHAGALARLKAVAEGGYAPAQFYMAKLYEAGTSGVTKNPVEARRWTARAAEGGDRSAMHNLALYYFRGEGGPQDLAAAARWFRGAAEAGVVDSQYNLGLLYQSGSGVERDLSEAYRWFTAAAAGGDAQARANAAELAAKLSPQSLAAAEKAAAAPRQPTAKTVATAAPARASGTVSGTASVTTAQRVLGRLGYYHGRVGGPATADFQVAVQNFQRDHDLPPTGSLDRNTVSQLSIFTR